MELTDITKPIENKVKPIAFDKFQKSGDWMVPRGRVYYTPMGNFVKGVRLCIVDVFLSQRHGNTRKNSNSSNQ